MSADAVRIYTSHRVRGLAAWNPQTKTRTLLDQIGAILKEYAEHLPLTCRQILYRLVGAYLYEKTEAAYDRLLETINRARRSGIIPFDAIRDDGAVENAPSGFSGLREAPPKATDRRGNWSGGTVQAEALAPDDLALEPRQAIEAVVNLDVLTETLKTEAAERRRLLKRLKAEDWS
jgi:hypothetical protein